jgi:hypothetical protein
MLLSGQHPLYNGAVHNDVPMLANNGTYYTREYTYGCGQLKHFAHQSDGSLDLRTVAVHALYSREIDPYQLNNLFDDPAYAGTKMELQSLTRKWMDKAIAQNVHKALKGFGEQRFRHYGRPNSQSLANDTWLILVIPFLDQDFHRFG